MFVTSMMMLSVQSFNWNCQISNLYKTVTRKTGFSIQIWLIWAACTVNTLASYIPSPQLRHLFFNHQNYSGSIVFVFCLSEFIIAFALKSHWHPKYFSTYVDAWVFFFAVAEWKLTSSASWNLKSRDFRMCREFWVEFDINESKRMMEASKKKSNPLSKVKILA